MSGKYPRRTLDLAKEQLGLPTSTPDEAVPDFYLQELKQHLMMCPDEFNFRVTLEPESGFGTVTCLKDKCNQILRLLRRFRVPDGGKVDGFGSLTSYRTHIVTAHGQKTRGDTKTPTAHPPTKVGNVKTVQTITKKTQVKQEPQESYVGLPSHAARDLRKAVVPIKPEPVEPSMLSKRLSVASLENADSDSLAAVKNPKGELSKSPLLPVTNTAAQGQPLRPDATTSPSTGGPMSLQGIDHSIDALENFLATLWATEPKNAAHMRQIIAYQTELGVLREKRQAYCNSMARPVSTLVPSHNITPPPLEFPSWTKAEEHIPYTGMSSTPMNAVTPAPAGDRNHYNSGMSQPVASTSTVGPIARPSPQLLQSNLDTFFIPQSSTGAGHAVDKSSSQALQQFHQNPTGLPHSYPRPDFSDQFMDSDGDSDMERAEYDLAAPFVQQLRMQSAFSNKLEFDYNMAARDPDAIAIEGPHATVEDVEKFLVETGNAEAFDGNATVDKAVEYLGLRNQHELISGMDITLMAHQLMGVAWMVEKERSSSRGGCLADEMGLGKTVQLIALATKCRSTNPKRKTNLIIAPVALLDQWKLEIETKTNCDYKCYIYHGGNKLRTKSEMLKYDFILTSFGTMSLEWPDFEGDMKKAGRAKRNGERAAMDHDPEAMRDPIYRENKRKQHAGLLFQVDFYRIIVDEAQTIRNPRTRVSRAITTLVSTYRWCLTGTPIINGLTDVYPYLRFLQIRPWYDWEKFNNQVAKYEKKRPDLAVTRLQAITESFLLRRKKDSMLDGKRLIELPDKTVDLVKLEFSEEEREIYNAVEAKHQAKFNRFLRAGTVLKNYHQVLVLLLRLRQICSHPSLIQEDGQPFVSLDEYGDGIKVQVANDLTRARRVMGQDFVNKLKQKFKAEALRRMAMEKQDANATLDAGDDECPICYELMTDGTVTSCCHIFCKECIMDLFTLPALEEDEMSRTGHRPCPVCRSPIHVAKMFPRAAFEPSENELASEEKATMTFDFDDDAPSPSSRKRKGKEIVRRKAKRPSLESRHGLSDDDDLSDFIVHSDEDEDEKDLRREMKKLAGDSENYKADYESDDDFEAPEVVFGFKKQAPVRRDVIQLMPRFLPSTKMKFMMEQLQKLAKSKPDEKTIVVSQWTSCLSLVSDYLTEKGIVHVKYQGDMNRQKRDQAVQIFMFKERARVMLMSSKCGGVGLNLTRANNVISLDLGWSQAVENQAFDRVHRLGQKLPVIVQRVVIAETVEDRILVLQERKQNLADGTLGEGNGKKIGRMSVRQLANLFGLDERGRPLNQTVPAPAPAASSSRR